MTERLEEFSKVLDREDREGAIELVHGWLERGEVDIVTLYNGVLTPSLNAWECPSEDMDVCVWREHVRSSIVRTVVEISHPYVIRERDRSGRERSGVQVAVLCPPEELHELGPRMVADFFTLYGYDVTFVGANTPIDDLIAAVGHIGPRYVAISVTNHYNLIAVRRAIERIRDRLPEGTEIVLGGRAIAVNPGFAEEVGADRVVLDVEGIRDLAGGD